MPRLAANLSMMFTEHAFLDRFAAAAEAGFRGVEYLFPYDFAAAEIAAALKANGLTQALFNLPPGDWQAGERGLASLPGRESEFRQGVERGLAYAQALGCSQVHMMAGIAPLRTDPALIEMTYLANLNYAAQQAAALGVHILIEPINPIDMPGYFLRSAAQAQDLIARFRQVAGADKAGNVGIQLDLYHRQMLEGRLAAALDDHLAQSPHIQIAGVPGRNEPDANGEVDWTWVLNSLDDRGYRGWVGCEYHPRGQTHAGLDWARPWLDQAEALA
jgi:hydroxypyruvate isomerase